MTTNDATAYPHPDEPERIGQLFGEVFDLVDETVDAITDQEVDHALRQVYADAELGEPADLDELAEMLARTGWKVSRTDPAALDPAALAAWDEATCAVRAARQEVRAARTAAAAARADAQRHLAAAAQAQQQAAEVTAGVNTFVDQALDEVETTKAAAREEAARLIEQAKQQAEEILATARTRAAAMAQPSPSTDSAVTDAPAGHRLLVLGQAGTGKTRIAGELLARIAEAGEVGALGSALWHANVLAPLAGLDLQRFASLLDPATTTFRDLVVHHDLVRQALVDAYSTPRLAAGSLRRTTVFRYLCCDDALDADLVPALDASGRPAAHHGPAAGATRWAQLVQKLLVAADGWKVAIPLEALDDCGIDAVADTWMRIGDRCDATTFQRLVIQVKRHHADTRTLRVPPSITLRSLLLYVSTVGEAAPPAPDAAELRSALDELAGTWRTDRLALGSGRPGG